MKNEILKPLFVVIGLFMLSAVLASRINAKANHGIPQLYGYSLLFVASDSMEGDLNDSFSKGSGLIVRRCDARTLNKGDIVSFYDRNIGAINTHRLTESPSFDGSVYHLHTRGDNIESDHYNYDGEYFTSEELLGIVVAKSDAVAILLASFSPEASAMASATGQQEKAMLYPLVVLLPLGALSLFATIYSIKEIWKTQKESEGKTVTERAPFLTL